MRGRSWAERAFALTTLALPGRLRRRDGAEMTATFLARLEAIGDRRARLRYAARNLWSLLGYGLRERLPLAPPRPGAWLADARDALRGLVRAPGYTLAVAATLGLGIGLNTGIFSIVQAVLLRPLPYSEPDRLVALNTTFDGQRWWAASVADVLEWREAAASLAAASFGQAADLALADDPVPVQVSGARVETGFFATLGVAPVLGRGLAPDDGREGAAPVVVITDGAWRRRFGSDPAILGRQLLLEGEPTRVVGVLPESFRADFFGNPDFWVPIRLTPTDRSVRARIHLALGRLAPGVGLSGAQAELDSVATKLAERDPEALAGWGVQAVELRGQLAAASRPTLLLLLGAVAFVLLVACTNVAHLALARGRKHRAELAVRAALGAGSSRLLRRALLESTLLALFGGLVGTGIAVASLGAAGALGSDLPRIDQVGIDAGVAAFTAGCVLLTALVAGLAPALRAARTLPAEVLRAGLRLPRRRWGRAALIGAEVGLVTILVLGALLVLQSLSFLAAVDPGFPVADRLMIEIDLPRSEYGAMADRQRIATFYTRLVEGVRAIPGVGPAATITRAPLLSAAGMTAYHLIEGRPAAPPGQEPVGGVEIVTPDYFETMGMELLEGRLLAPTDDPASAPVIVINDAMARRYWGPDEDPIGHRVALGPAANGADVALSREIVGIVRGVRYALDRPTRPRMYLPEAQLPMPMTARVLVVETVGRDPLDIVPAVRAAVTEIDPGVPLAAVHAAEQVRQRAMSGPRMRAILLALFGSCGLGLAFLGVYAIVSDSVRDRTHEIGVRLAIGSPTSRVAGTVVRTALLPALLGVGAALLLVAGFGGGVTDLLHGVDPLDPRALALTVLLLLASAGLAAFVPARRATRVDVVRTLRAL